ncbi:MAG TPA: Holliday junction branch migration DNA helicase RuvB [Patescibacteria group bacterium]|nr:Holliday junction branch migration DNA helicase RuvB [Patescibacteria group bacterium]
MINSSKDFSSQEQPKKDFVAKKLPEEETIENTLRPKSLDEFIGQKKLKKNLRVFIAAAKKRGDSLDHSLFYGSHGLGKTTISYIIAHELGAEIKTTSGPALEKVGDLASILTNLEDKGVLFIDELHRIPRAVEEILYPAMEEYALDIVVGKGPSAKVLRLDLPEFTLVGATTRPSLLSPPLRDRFGLSYQLDFYNNNDISKIIKRSAKILGVKLEKGTADDLAKRSRFTPRVANRLLRRVRDFTQVKEDGKVKKSTIMKTMEMLEVDDKGLNQLDRKILSTIIKEFSGGPVGIKNLAVAIGEHVSTIEEMYEPYLIRLNFLQRTSRGRMATKKAYDHLGYKSIF